MIILHLYRYVFCDWNTLPQTEKDDALVHLKPFINNPLFQAALHHFKAQALYEALYGNKQPDAFSDYAVTQDEHIRNYLVIFNKRYHYFDDKKTDDYFNVFSPLFQLFYFVNALDKGHHFLSNGSFEIAELCYRIMVFFGHDNLEETVSRFVDYCQTNQLTFEKVLVESALVFKLTCNLKNQSIDLPGWRPLMARIGLPLSLKLFHIAHEIGYAPATPEEAWDAAQSRHFAHASQYPDYAQICIRHFISEDLFNRSISSDSMLSTEARLAIIRQLPPDGLDGYIRFMPDLALDLNLTLLFLKALRNWPAHQVTWINHFSTPLKCMIVHSNKLALILAELSSVEAQKTMINCLGIKYIEQLMSGKSMYDFEYLCKNIHSDYRNEFIFIIIGNTRLINAINSSHDLQLFMHIAMPEQNQVLFLKERVGVEKIRALIINFYHVAEQLKEFRDEEKITYLSEVVGHKRLVEVLSCNWCMLESVLTPLPAEQRITVLFDIIGVDALRQIVPVYGDLRARDAVLALLPKEQGAVFLDRLAPEEEKKAREQLLKTKNRILTQEFTLGLLGVGLSGAVITLSNGSTKTVPKTVKSQLDWIQLAEDNRISCVTAWQEVSRLAHEVRLGLPSFFRSQGTRDYYNSFPGPSPSNS